MKSSKNCHQNDTFLPKHYTVDHGNYQKSQKIPKLFQESFYNFLVTPLPPPTLLSTALKSIKQ